MNKLFKTSLSLAVVTAITAVAIAPTATYAVWSDGSANGRPVFTIDQINKGALGNKITFNSITDGVIGDERSFVNAREENAKKTQQKAGMRHLWYDEIQVKENTDYIVRMYVHNNNPKGLEAVAENVRATFNVSQGKAKQEQRVGGYITTANATPRWYYDDVVFKSDRPFKLAYVEGSALLERNDYNSVNAVNRGDKNVEIKGVATKLSDDVVKSSGALLGENGKMPGCFGYANYVTIKVRPVFAETDVMVEKNVRIAGTKAWKDYVIAKVGDKVQYGIQFKNIRGNRLGDVMIKDILPKNVKFVPGSVKLFNSNHKDGVAISDAVVNAGANIGAYATGANAWVVFDAEVIDNDLACGLNRVRNWGQAGMDKETIQDYADVMIFKECVPKKPEKTIPELPKTGPAETAIGVIGLGSIITAAGYYIASRKKLQ